MKHTFSVARIILSFSLLTFSTQTVFADENHAHGPDGSHVVDTFDSGATGKVVTLDQNAIRNLGIQTDKATRKRLAPTEALYGRIVVDPRRVSAIGARFNGQVEKVYVLPGELVEEGEELIKIRPIQVGSTTTILKAPAAGYVTTLSASRGMVFETSDTLLEISDISQVLFEGDMFDSAYADSIRKGDRCTVSMKRFSGKTFPCHIETIDASLQGNPPVGHVHVSLNNADTVLKPGMTGQLHLEIGETEDRLLIANNAILGRFEHQFVYVRQGSTFYRREVKLGKKFVERVEVLDGVEDNDDVVVQGHYQLQFASSSPDIAPESDDHSGDDHSGDDHSGHDHSGHDHSEHKHSGHDHKPAAAQHSEPDDKHDHDQHSHEEHHSH